MNSLIQWLQLNEVRGKYAIYRLGLKLGIGRKLIRHKIKDKDFYVPWDQWCFWLEYGPANYYPEDIKPLADVILQFKGSSCLLDLGADIGTVSAQLDSQSPLDKIIALEPNPNSFKILQKNAESIGFLPLNLAISDFNGLVNLNFNTGLGSDHEGYIDKNVPGSTQVVTIDHLYSAYALYEYKNIVIKIDVEGQEVAALAGAKSLLKQCENVVIMVEIHPDVLKRENITAEDIFIEAEKHREFTWFVPSQSNQVIDRNTPFFKQFTTHQYDVIGIAAPITT
ncbi:FkbM family methyltransferase [Catenovulum agarivorans]|uniref:FkbM family methyltransferase n=1 Tax=Catenovulum agarivorans TaxID=1172192 RepID=UPI0003753C2C|nr:FkbM family methyltransferase [Catenovulum agarivorans]